MKDKGFNRGSELSKRIDYDVDGEKCFDFVAYKKMAAWNKNFIMVVSQSFVVKRIENKFETQGNELEASDSMRQFLGGTVGTYKIDKNIWISLSTS